MKIELSGGRILDSSSRPLVMGIINCTPDSFYEGSRKPGIEDGLAQALRMIEDGADILDIGGESSRPGSEYIDEEEELRRVVPVVKEIRRLSNIPVSVDTRKAAVARAVLDEGADIINDISSLKDDNQLGLLVSEYSVPVVLMHKQGNPDTMQNNPHYKDVVTEICDELEFLVGRAASFGIARDRIIVDPGIGFGKRVEDNLAVIRETARFRALGYPLLIGLSRKSFLKTVTGREAQDRLAGSLAANIYAAMKGADILRVHDVAETVDALKVIAAISGK